ncbi:MAG: hypothetical protein MUF83_18275 [Acidimicrobiales bacterium]|jgi:hypothetical protein|nr:hypothetical protein [Acidimicrobiales bacterium]
MRRVLLGAGMAGLLLGLAAVPASAGVQRASISLDKTVSTADECGTSGEISVVVGTDVYYCYTVTNTGAVSFNTHDLTDDVLGDLLTQYDYVLEPSESVSLVIDPVTIDVETENCATWSAYNMSPPITTPPDDAAAVDQAITAPVTATDCALVTVTPAPSSSVAPSSTAAPATTAKAKAAAAVPTYTG